MRDLTNPEPGTADAQDLALLGSESRRRTGQIGRQAEVGIWPISMGRRLQKKRASLLAMRCYPAHGNTELASSYRYWGFFGEIRMSLPTCGTV